MKDRGSKTTDTRRFPDHINTATTPGNKVSRAGVRVEPTASRTYETACTRCRSLQQSDSDTQRVRVDSKVDTSTATKLASFKYAPTWRPSETNRHRSSNPAFARLNGPIERTSEPKCRRPDVTLNRLSWHQHLMVWHPFVGGHHWGKESTPATFFTPGRQLSHLAGREPPGDPRKRPRGAGGARRVLSIHRHGIHQLY